MNFFPVFRKILIITNIVIITLLLSNCSQQTNSYQGYAEGELIYVASPYSGNLQNIYVHRGDLVEKNKMLFNLDPEPQISEMKQAQSALQEGQYNLENLIKGERNTILESIQAQIDQTNANLVLAKVRLDRAKKLLKSEAVSQDEYDAALANYQALQNQLKQYQANLAEAKLGSRSDLIAAQESRVANLKATLDEAQWALTQKTAIATTDAYVYDTYYRLGEFVPNGSPVLSLLAPQYINIIFFLPEAQLGKIKLGEQITVQCNGCQKSYSAHITYISPEAEYTPPVIYSRESSYKLVFRIKAKPDLKDAYDFHPGQPVLVTFPAKN